MEDLTRDNQLSSQSAAIFSSRFRCTAVEEATILQCNSCALRVHETCYGAKNSSSVPWECDRCREKEFNKVCSLHCHK